MRRRIAQGAIFSVLLLMSVAIPLMIEAIFPGGRGESAVDHPAEVPVATLPSSSRTDAIDTRENIAWLSGDAGSVLDAGAGSARDAAEDALDADADGVVESEEGPGLPLDLRPGVFVGYTRSWDNLEIRREQYTAGAFTFISSHTRLQASASRLRLYDDTDKLYGEAFRFDGAHRLPGGWLLEEGIELDQYDHLHDSWNGDARLSGALTPKLGVTIEGGRSDMWERLPNIRDRLRLWQAGLGLFYQLLPRWWLAGYGNAGWLSDSNGRLSLGGEGGYMIFERIGLSASAGMETTTFREQRLTYWSPAYYHYIFGRLRLTRNFERYPFEPLPSDPMTRAERWGYLAEVTSGVNDDGRLESSFRAGVRYRATRSVSFHGLFYHLASDGRFDDSFAENRVDAGAEVRF